ncbi:MAG: ATP-grasp domain-containing protein [Pseudonocardiaceae bacterium]|nr:ATP-grasp domain-containing protein [Pseudonocardiaceae bacterium]
MIRNVLVANRGEIARRVFRSCRALGIDCVAVYSDADAGAPYVREADAAVHLPGTASADTYLRADLLLDAARAAGADAVHPGYGFLSEDAAFARLVEEAGLTWIGPPSDAISSMASKIEAKRIMANSGVPVLGELDPDKLAEGDLPVLIKASAGGGGRGMRIVRSLGELAGAVESAGSEAASAFGDSTVFCEPFLDSGRHIEVQVLADRHGTVWAVGERECSIQRRHQKVLEESPSPLVERHSGMREQLYDAAKNAAKAIDYVGAGTVEFLADVSGRFFFLEMNTRLQVEHPVTECTTGLDLVSMQLRIAEGLRLPPEPPIHNGHSIEVRLYAEDPAHSWRPQSGMLHRFELDGVLAEFEAPARHGVRLDSGVLSGSEVSVYYDPLLAKVISWAPSRDEAARGLAAALRRARIHGLTTNRDLLVRVLRHPDFLAGETDTGFFDRHGVDTLSAPLADEAAEQVSALAAALADGAVNRASATVLTELPSAWRNVVSQPQRKTYTTAGAEHEVRYRLTRSGLRADNHPDVRLISLAPDRVELAVAGVRRDFAVSRYPGLVCVDSALGSVTLVPEPRFVDPAKLVAPGSLLAPMPGTVVRVAVSTGDSVAEGQTLLWLEAMKMEHAIAAPATGVVGELPVEVGQQVDLGAVLAVLESAGTDEEER